MSHHVPQYKVQSQLFKIFQLMALVKDFLEEKKFLKAFNSI
jgi:hypothetical protein